MQDEEFKIEKDIPIPPARRSSKRKYPFNKMQIGESILIEGDRKKLRKASCAAQVYGKRNSKKFISRLLEKDGEFFGVRLWRVE